MVQQSRAIPIGKIDQLIADVTTHLLRGETAASTSDLDWCVDQIKHPIRRGHGALVVVQCAAESGERPEQPLGDEDKKAVSTNCDHAIPGLNPPDKQNGQECKQNGETDQWNESGRDPDGMAVALPVGITFPA